MLPLTRVTTGLGYGVEYFFRCSGEKWTLDVLERWEGDADVIGIRKFFTALHELEAMRRLSLAKGGIHTV